MSYILVTGAPGSKWSSVVKNIYWSEDIDHTDYSEARTYWHDAETPGTKQLMHTGAYWDPGMEFMPIDWDGPFSGKGKRIIKSHTFAHELEELKVKGYPIVLVLRSDGGCMDWWRKCGAFNITYPNYQYYKTRTIMWSHIKNQNRDIKLFYQNNQENITEVKNNEELCKSLEIAYPKDTPLHDYKEKMSEYSSTSNWEGAKSKSTYHFNKWHKDTECVEHLGRFTGGWQTELLEVINDAKPLNWSNRREGSGRPDGDVEAEENDLIKAGADPKMTIYRGLKDFTKCPTLQKMTDFFALDPVKSKLHIQFTGEVLNMHIDKLYDLDADPNNVIRIMIMLQDWEPGQFLMYGNQQFDRWRAGDIHKFDWPNIPHATANASNKPRPMLVVTGVISETTKKILGKEIKKRI